MIVKKTIKKFYNMFVSFNHEKIIKHIASENIDNNMRRPSNIVVKISSPDVSIFIII